MAVTQSPSGAGDGLDNVDHGDENHAERAPLVLGPETFHSITDRVADITERKTSRNWLFITAFTGLFFMVLAASLMKLVGTGIGVWGLNNTVGCAWDIT